jgi:hypothetical protein
MSSSSPTAAAADVGTTVTSGAPRLVSPAFLDRLDRGCDTFRRTELLYRHTTPEDSDGVIKEIVDALNVATEARKFVDPVLPLMLRRLLKLCFNDVAQPYLEPAHNHIDATVIKCLDAMIAEKATSPPFAAECTTLLLVYLQIRADMGKKRILQLLAAPNTLNHLMGLFRVASVLGHFPILVPCMRLFTLLYNRYASARIAARDKNLPGLVSDLNRRYEFVPAIVSSAAIELLMVMSQWIPRRKDRVAGIGLDAAAAEQVKASYAARGSPDGGAGGKKKSPQRGRPGTGQGGSVLHSLQRHPPAGTVLSPIRANFKGLPLPLASSHPGNRPFPVDNSAALKEEEANVRRMMKEAQLQAAAGLDGAASMGSTGKSFFDSGVDGGGSLMGGSASGSVLGSGRQMLQPLETVGSPRLGRAAKVPASPLRFPSSTNSKGNTTQRSGGPAATSRRRTNGGAGGNTGGVGGGVEAEGSFMSGLDSSILSGLSMPAMGETAFPFDLLGDDGTVDDDAGFAAGGRFPSLAARSGGLVGAGVSPLPSARAIGAIALQGSARKR